MVESKAEIDLVALTADIVSAYVSNNTASAADLAQLIASVHGSLVAVAVGKPVEAAAPALVPCVPINKSVSKDFIICLEDGQKFRSLKRHLRTQYNMSPQEYRAKWSLPDNYPMVAPHYSQERSRLAKKMGLGSVRRRELNAA